MRWDRRIRFAIMPVDCDSCYNKIWLERYTTQEKIGLDYARTVYTCYYCQKCRPIVKKKEGKKNG